MRKVLILLLAGFLITGMAVSVKAAQLETSGYYFINFDWMNNTNTFFDDSKKNDIIRVSRPPVGEGLPAVVPIQGPAPCSNITPGLRPCNDDSVSLIWQRFFFNMAFVTDKDLKAVVGIEIDDGFGVFGGEPSAGRVAGGMGGSVGQFRTDDNTSVEIKNAYMEFKIPATPVTAKLGPQTYFIGPYGNFLYVDAAGLTFTTDMAKPFLLSAFTYKIREGAIAGADDTDVYGAWLRGTTSGINIQAYGLFQSQNSPTDGDAIVRDGRPVTVSAAGGSRISGPSAFLERVMAARDTNAFLAPDNPGNAQVRFLRKADFIWLGASGETKFGPWSFFGNVIWSRADLDLFTNALQTSFKTDGFFLDGIVGYQLGNIKIEAEGVWTSPLDLSKKEPNVFFSPYTEAGAYNGRGIVFLESALISWAVARTDYASSAPVGDGQINWVGLWLARLAATMQATPKLSATMNFVWIGDNTKNGDLVGDFGNDAASFARNGDDKTIGQEVDIWGEYQIYKNLRLKAGFGYLFAGKALDGFNALGQRVAADDAWAAVSRLNYTF